MSLSNKSYTAGKSYRVNRPTLTASDAAGTRGMYAGREAMRVDIGGKPYVVATLNEGARTEEDYGDYKTFADALSQFSASTEGYSASYVWRLPTESELTSFSGISNTSATVNSVNGQSFTIVTGKTLFLPAAGWLHGGSVDYRGPLGYYWSSTGGSSDRAYGLYFDDSDCVVYDDHSSNGSSVRLFCALFSNDLTASDPAGTEGTYKGREAMRVDLGGKAYVVAKMNEGATSEEDYGTFTYDDALEQFSNSTDSYDATDVWRLPTQSELNSFKEISNSWTTVNSVNGQSFTIATGKTLFLPASGFLAGSVRNRGSNGNYRSSTGDSSDYAYSLYFDSSDDCYVDIGSRSRGQSVRLFCALPSE